MRTYYCDGSQHKGYNKLGIGIVSGETEYHFNTSEYDHDKCIYEIEAIRKTIEVAVKDGCNKIVVVNDDRSLVKKIQEIKQDRKITSSALRKKEEFKSLVKLIKGHDVQVRCPKTTEDKINIRRCHHLSRRYML